MLSSVAEIADVCVHSDLQTTDRYIKALITHNRPMPLVFGLRPSPSRLTAYKFRIASYKAAFATLTSATVTNQEMIWVLKA